MVFNARSAKLLAAGAHIIVEEAPGLRLNASATAKTWLYRYKSPVDGRMRQVTIGRWPEMSFGAAFAAWSDLRVRRDAGEDLSQAKRQAAAEVKAERAAQRKHAAPAYLVLDLINDYLIGHVERNRKLKGVKETRRLLTGYTAAIQQLQPHEITRAIAFDLLDNLANTAPVLANNLRGELGGAWDYGLDSGRIEPDVPNWWRLVLRGKIRSKGRIILGEHQGQKVLRTLNAAEVSKLLRYLPNFTRLNQDMLEMYLWTGTRGSEIVGMMGAEVTSEPDGLWWTIPKERLKMARVQSISDHRIPLLGRAREVVERRVERYGTGYLFPSKPGSESPHIDQKVVGVAVWQSRPTTKNHRIGADIARLEIEPWAPHDLRRTVRTTLAALGCSDEVGEAIIGHVPPGTTAIYNRHKYDQERRHWLGLLSTHWESLLVQA